MEREPPSQICSWIDIIKIEVVLPRESCLLLENRSLGGTNSFCPSRAGIQTELTVNRLEATAVPCRRETQDVFIASVTEVNYDKIRVELIQCWSYNHAQAVEMDIQEIIREWKKDPEFVARVGMILCHYGMVRGTSRENDKPVEAVRVTADQARIETLRREYEAFPGICRIAVEAREGLLCPGDDLLFLLVAGDIREHVKPVLAELLDRIKTEGVQKEEFLAESP